MKIPNSNLVSVQWLRQHLQHNKLKVLYTQMTPPASVSKAQTPHKYIPNSVLFDFEQVFCDLTSALPHTMPSADLFTKEAQKLGINKDSVIVVYDAMGIYSSPRVWWMFKSMGHHNVRVLNGGLPLWLASVFPTVDSLDVPKALGNFQANVNAEYFISADAILQKQNSLNLLDARSAGRFNGTAPEPREGVRRGHAPGAINLPFELCLKQGRMISPSALKGLFSALPLSTNPDFVFSCGSGVTACVLALAASEAGYHNLAVYDGSWSEWGSRTDLPVINPFLAE